MHKKILYGIISVAALSMITGCGSKASDGANNVNTTEVINTQDSQDTNSESEGFRKKCLGVKKGIYG